MCITFLQLAFFSLTPCRRKLLEARRTKDDYNTAKISYDQAREQFHVVLETWKGQEYMQITENRQLLKRAYALISKKAEEFINKAIESTLRDFKLGKIQLVDGNLGRRASTGERQVRPNNSLSLCMCLPTYAEGVTYREARFSLSRLLEMLKNFCD